MSAGAGARIVVVIGVCLTATWATAASTPPQKSSVENTRQIVKQNRALAKSGDASAEYNLGVLYDQGTGVEQNYPRARHWYKKAAAQHYARAEHNLAIMYQSGKGVPRDMAKAAYWFRRGANDGQPASQNNLSVLYMRGVGVAQNTGKAAFWAARAAAGGNSAAIANLPLITADLPHRHVDADNVNVRDQPDQSARIVGHLDSDTIAVVLTRRDHWTQLLLANSDSVGWVSNALLSNSQAPLANTIGPKTPPLISAKADTAEAAPSAVSPPHVGPSGVTRGRLPASPPAASQARPAPERKAKPIPKRAPAAKPKPASRSVDLLTAPAENSANKPVMLSTQFVKPPVAAKISRETVPALSAAAELVHHPATPRVVTQSRGARHHATKSGARKSQSSARIGVDVANLRAKPSTQAKVLGQLHRGDRVNLRKSHDGWRFIQTQDGLLAWIAGYLLVTP